jgi:ATP-dependent 26S proteasome regulatory subunit
LNIDQYTPLKKNNNKKITIYERAGTYLRLYYEKRIFDISKFYPTDKQSPIIESIINIFNKKKNASIFISGEPGSGKSMIGFLIAKELNAKLVRTFNPIEPGDTMISMIRDIEPTDENPLIIIMDEADILINKIVDNKIIQHKNIPVMIFDKTSYNRFMDDMMFYENVILILTSNQSKRTIDSLDTCFLRSGRIDENFIL